MTSHRLVPQLSRSRVLEATDDPSAFAYLPLQLRDVAIFALLVVLERAEPQRL